MTSTSQTQTAAGVLIVVAIYLVLMLLQALAEKDDPLRCSRELSHLDPACRRAVVGSP
jgi:hypothetical protein